MSRAFFVNYTSQNPTGTTSMWDVYAQTPPQSESEPTTAPPPTRITLKNFLASRKFMAERTRKQLEPPSLIFRLPPEMLAEVFLHLTAHDPEIPPNDGVFLMDTHFTVSHVCGLWRAVALHTPVLWSRVVLHLGARTSKFAMVKAIAQTCFARSHELPLALIITSSASGGIPNIVIDLVVPVRQRVRHLTLRIPGDFAQSVFKLPRSAFRELRTLEMTATGAFAFTIGHWFSGMSALEGAPHLESVVLRCPPASSHWPSTMLMPEGPRFFNPATSGLPWTQLLQLCLLDNLCLPFFEAVNLIELAVNASRVAVNIIQGPVALARTEDERVQAPALRVLELTASGPDFVPQTGGPGLRADVLHVSLFFLGLVLPALEELAIHANFGNQPLVPSRYQMMISLPGVALSAMQKRSRFSLRKLEISGACMEGLGVVLEDNPMLERLKFAQCGMNLRTLAVLLTRGNEEVQPTPSLPNLRELVLLDRWTDEFPASAWTAGTRAFMAMVRSRWRIDSNSSEPRLQRLDFSSRASLSPKKMTRLNRWQSEGLDFRYTGPESFGLVGPN